MEVASSHAGFFKQLLAHSCVQLGSVVPGGTRHRFQAVVGDLANAVAADTQQLYGPGQCRLVRPVTNPVAAHLRLEPSLVDDTQKAPGDSHAQAVQLCHAAFALAGGQRRPRRDFVIRALASPAYRIAQRRRTQTHARRRDT
jgi:hypothetical protein